MTALIRSSKLHPGPALAWLAVVLACLLPAFAQSQPKTQTQAQAQTQAPSKAPVWIGVDAEFGVLRSSSAQAIEMGAEAAIEEINAAGGVLGGRPLKLVTRDNRSVPARGVENLKELAAIPDLVAVLGGRFSPVIIEQLPLIREYKLPFIAVWSSADQITRNGMQPNFVFRVSLHDSLAMPFMLDHAAKRGLRRVGLLLSNTAWGRSNLAAANAHLRTGAGKSMSIVRSSWFSWADTTLVSKYLGMVDAGAQAIIVVANDEAALLVREVAALPKSKRVPLILHWGVSGGEFVEKSGAALHEVDVSVLQTFSPQRADPAMRARFLKAASAQGVHRFEDIRAAVGAAHAYDAVHLLARATSAAGSTDRSKVRAALERLPAWRGLVKNYAPAFTAANHEAFARSDLLMMRFGADGLMVPR